MPIRVICTECNSKLDIRDELAGSKRRCPKCKTEFTVPVPAQVATEGSLADETPPAATAPPTDDDVTNSPTAEESAEHDELDADDNSSPLVAPQADALSADEETDDDDLDYLPDFVTSAPAANSSGKPAGRGVKQTVEADDEDEDDDDEPVLAIPKIPDPPKSKPKAFDPAFLEEDENEEEDDEDETTPPPKKAAQPTGRGGSKIPSAAMDEFFANTFDKPGSTPDFKLPTPNRGAIKSETPTDTRNVTRDRAQAARELRQALKDSALNQATVGQQRTAGIGFDLIELFQDFGLKGLAVLLGGTLLTIAVYYASDYAMGGPKRPPLGYVSGVLMMDGNPVPNARLYFRPEFETTKIREMKRTSIGSTDDKGKFRMMYEQNIPGVAVGKCRVWLELPHPLRVPPDYTITSTKTIDVNKGSQTIDFPLTSKPKQ